MSRIEKDSFDSEDVESSLGQASETDDADDMHSIKSAKNQQNASEKSQSQVCVHDKKQLHFDKSVVDSKPSEMQLPPPCKCRWFGNAPKPNEMKPVEVRIVSCSDRDELSPLIVNHNAAARMAASVKPSTSTSSAGSMAGSVTFVRSPSSASDAMQMGSSAPSLHLLAAPSRGMLSNSTTPTPATSPTPASTRKLSFSTPPPHIKSGSVVTW